MRAGFPLVSEGSPAQSDEAQREKESAVTEQPQYIGRVRGSCSDQGVCHFIEFVNGRQQLYGLAAPVALGTVKISQYARAQPHRSERHPVVARRHREEKPDSAHRDVDERRVKKKIDDAEGRKNRPQQAGQHEHGRNYANHANEKELGVIENRIHRLREQEPVVAQLAIGGDNAVDSNENRQGHDRARHLEHQAPNGRRATGSHLRSHRVPQRHQQYVAPQKGDNEDRNSALEHEITKLPERVSRQTGGAFHCDSPTASRNCCSSTDLSGTTLATSTPLPIRSASAALSSARLCTVTSYAPRPASSAWGNTARMRSCPLARVTLNRVPATRGAFS